MKLYYITSSGQQSGPFPEEELKNQLSSGRFNRNDLYWTEGMDQWQPIHEAIELANSLPKTPPPPPPPLPEISVSSQRSDTVPLTQQHPQSQLSGYTDIQQVPWIRRSSSCNILFAISIVTAGLFPGFLIVAIILITGDVYFKKDYTADGTLKKWGVANKWAAYVIAAASCFYIFLVLIGQA
jgi:hypothetical protein